MVKKFAIKQPKPQAAVIGKPQERIVFGFSELRPYSYVNCHNDSLFFISILERLKKLSSLDCIFGLSRQQRLSGYIH